MSRLQGFLYNDAGEPIQGATVTALEAGTTTTIGSTDSTDANGSWQFTSGLTGKNIDVKIQSGSSIRYLKHADHVQVEHMWVRSDTAAGTPPARIENSTNNASNAVLELVGDNSTRADGDEIYVSFKLDDDGGNETEFARITAEANDVTNGEEDGELRFGVMVSGTLTDVFTINSSTAGVTDMNLDVSGDLTLDADGGDIFFKDGGTTFGSATNNSGNLIIKSGTTTAATFTGANVDFAGTVSAGGTTLLSGGAVTSITSVLNTSLVLGRDADNDIDFGTDNNIIFRAGAADQIKLIDGALAPVADNDVDLGTSSLEFKDAFFDGTVTSDAFAGPLTGDVTGNADTATALATGRTIGMTGDVVWTSASFTGAGNVTGSATIQSDAVESGMLNDNIISGQTEISSGLADADELLYSDGGVLKRVGLDTLSTKVLTGNAASATILATARAINGVDFDGSAAITVTAAGSTLSDTVPVSKGGTNATSLADKAVLITQDSGTDTVAAAAMSTNGQLLIGGTSGPAVATLTAGSGIGITNADGGITIASTASAGASEGFAIAMAVAL